MRASSPWLVALAAAAILLSAAPDTLTAEPIQITIRASDAEAMNHPSTAEVHANVARVVAAADAFAARKLPPDVISSRAALDAARGAGLKEGVAPWRVVLDFSSEHGAIVWHVANTTSSAAGNTEGRRFVIEATSGKVLARDRWYAIVG